MRPAPLYTDRDTFRSIFTCQRNTPPMKHTLYLSTAQGRICLKLHCCRMGQDIQICLTGGKAHVGAVALALPNADIPAMLIRPGHKEGELAALMAETLARSLNCAVCVSAGIHYPNITRDEILTVESLSRKLTEQCLHQMQ